MHARDRDIVSRRLTAGLAVLLVLGACTEHGGPTVPDGPGPVLYLEQMLVDSVADACVLTRCDFLDTSSPYHDSLCPSCVFTNVDGLGGLYAVDDSTIRVSYGNDSGMDTIKVMIGGWFSCAGYCDGGGQSMLTVIGSVPFSFPAFHLIGTVDRGHVPRSITVAALESDGRIGLLFRDSTVYLDVGDECVFADTAVDSMPTWDTVMTPTHYMSVTLSNRGLYQRDRIAFGVSP
jgi:hypothetical protein